MRQARPDRHRLGRALVAAAALAVTAVPSAPAAAGAEGLCRGEKAAAEQVLALADAHNARYLPGPQPPAVANPYNAEADRLAAQQDATAKALEACSLTEQLVAGEPGAPPVKPATPEMVQKIKDAAKSLDPARPHSGQSADRSGYRTSADLRPLYNVFRSRPRYGDVQLQGTNQPKAGTADRANRRWTIQRAMGGGPAVSADHIVPLVEILERPDFLRLSAENMYLVVNAPTNLQWLSFRANRAKSSRSMAFVNDVDDAFWAEQIQLEANALSRLDRLIQHLLATQQ